MNKAGLTTRHTTKCRTYTRIDVELGPLATSTPFLSFTDSDHGVAPCGVARWKPCSCNANFSTDAQKSPAEHF